MLPPRHKRFKRSSSAFLRAFGDAVIVDPDGEGIAMTGILRMASDQFGDALGGSGVGSTFTLLHVATEHSERFPENIEFEHEGQRYQVASGPSHDGRGMTSFDIALKASDG